MKRFQRPIRILGRLLVAAMVAAFMSLIGLQYARVIGQNLALSRSLHDVETDIATLTAKRADQEREIARLSDPLGAIPEIHDRLHLVDPHEAIIYLKGSAPDDAAK
jgi:cell division protein FtsB